MVAKSNHISCLLQFGHAWLLFLMVTYLPKYMNDVLNVSLRDNGLYSSIPYVAMWIVNIASGYLCDFLYKQGINLTFLRKLFAWIGWYFYFVNDIKKQCREITFSLLNIGDKWQIPISCV